MCTNAILICVLIHIREQILSAGLNYAYSYLKKIKKMIYSYRIAVSCQDSHNSSYLPYLLLTQSYRLAIRCCEMKKTKNNGMNKNQQFNTFQLLLIHSNEFSVWSCSWEARLIVGRESMKNWSEHMKIWRVGILYSRIIWTLFNVNG